MQNLLGAFLSMGEARQELHTYRLKADFYRNELTSGQFDGLTSGFLYFLQLSVAERFRLFIISFFHLSFFNRASLVLRLGLSYRVFGRQMQCEREQIEVRLGLNCKIKGKKVKK